jgi:hypothetical protein
MDQPGISVKSEDDRLVLSEYGIELSLAEAVRMFLGGLKLHKVDDVYDSDFEIGNELAKDIDRRQRLQRRHVSATRHYYVRLVVAVIAGPLPDAEARGAVFDGLIHREPNRGRLLAGYNHIYIIATAQAVVGYR